MQNNHFSSESSFYEFLQNLQQEILEQIDKKASLDDVKQNISHSFEKAYEEISRQNILNEEVARLKKSFPQTRLLDNKEVLVHERGNQWFNLGTCESHQEVEYKVLEYFCRGAFKTEPYRRSDLNRQFHEYMRAGINDYFGTDFTEEDMELIYTYLGNGIHRELTIQFFESGFDLAVLEDYRASRQKQTM